MEQNFYLISEDISKFKLFEITFYFISSLFLLPFFSLKEGPRPQSVNKVFIAPLFNLLY